MLYAFTAIVLAGLFTVPVIVWETRRKAGRPASRATRYPCSAPSRQAVSALREGIGRREPFDDLPHQLADGDWPFVPRQLTNGRN